MSDAFSKFYKPTSQNPYPTPPNPQAKPEPPTYKVFCPEGRVWEAHGWPRIIIDHINGIPVLVFYDTPGNWEDGEMTAGFTRWEAFEEVKLVMGERDGSGA